MLTPTTTKKVLQVKWIFSINFSPKLEAQVEKEILSFLSTSFQICSATAFYGRHIPLHLHFSSSANYFYQKRYYYLHLVKMYIQIFFYSAS